MKQKPRGQKYRNLSVRRASPSIYYQRCIGERRVRFSTKTDDWDQAVAVRDLYEKNRGLGGARFFTISVPRFGEAAERYLSEAIGHLATTTQSDRTVLLRPTGLLTLYWGSTRIDQISKAALLEWWAAEVTGRGRMHKTGLNLARGRLCRMFRVGPGESGRRGSSRLRTRETVTYSSFSRLLRAFKGPIRRFPQNDHARNRTETPRIEADGLNW